MLVDDKTFFVIVAVYLIGYAALRTVNVEVWDKNGHKYVLFPERPIVLYYLFCPLTYADLC